MGSWSSMASAAAGAMDEGAYLALMLIGGGVWLLVGGIFLIVGIAMLVGAGRKQRSCTAVAPGQVLDIVGSRGSSGGVVWSPVFAFTVGGLEYRHAPSYASSRIRYAIGEAVEVRYDPSDPHRCYIAGERGPRVLAIVFTAVGGACSAIGVIWMAVLAVLG